MIIRSQSPSKVNSLSLSLSSFNRKPIESFFPEIDSYYQHESLGAHAPSALTSPAPGALVINAKSQAATQENQEDRFFGFVSKDENGSIWVSDDGEILQLDSTKRVVKDRSDVLNDRFNLQSVVASVLPDSRTAKCLRVSTGSDIIIQRSVEHGTHSLTGLQTCGSVWTCPVCSAKITERRRNELKQAIERHKEQGGSLIFVTYTFPHQQEDDLKLMLDNLKGSLTDLKSHRQYKSLTKQNHQIGTVRALEVTHGVNGWHPHIHELWFVSGPVTSDQLDNLQSDLYTCWRRSAIKNGFSTPTKKHGVHCQNGDFAEDYVAKFGCEPSSQWGVDSELSKLHTKTSSKGKTPFQLLRDVQQGDEIAQYLFVEYARCFKGRRQLVWSRGLKDYFQIDHKSDDEIAATDEGLYDKVVTISSDLWKNIVISHTKICDMPQFLVDNRALILSQSEKSLDHLQIFFESILHPKGLSLNRQGSCFSLVQGP